MRLVVLVIFTVATFTGCDARTQVLQDNITARVDRLLGDFQVKQKQAEIAIGQIQTGIDQLKRAKIETKVRNTQLSDQVKAIELKTAEVDKAILKLRDFLSQGGEVEISGKKFSEIQVKEMAEKSINARKKLSSDIEVLQKSAKQMEAILTSLEQRESDGTRRLEKLKQTLDEIKTKSVALVSMQETSATTGVGSGMDFESLEKQVTDLSSKIDVEIAFQEEKAKSDSTSTSIGSIDDILSTTSTVDDTISEIDKLLGTK